MTNRTTNLSNRFAVTGLEESDLGQVLALERDSFPHPWTRGAFLTSIRTDFGRALAILDQSRKDRTVIGYLCCWVKPRSVQVVNICVAGSYRNQGLGRALLGVLASWAGRNGKNRLTLEVRPGNRPAIGLYESLGFVRTGIQEGYYKDTGEDALLLELRLRSDLTENPSRPGPGPVPKKAVDDAFGDE